MGRKFLLLTLIMAVLGVPLGIISASRPALAATTPEVWDEEVPGEEPAINEENIDAEDDVWDEEPNTPSDTSPESEAPDNAEVAPKPAPPQKAPGNAVEP